MLVTMNEVLKYAEEHNCAVGSFNTPTLENLWAVIDAAEKKNVPVIIMHAELHEPIAPLSLIGPIMVLVAKNSKVPVCVHLDHGEHLEYIEKALKLGFTSVMYDGSLLPYDINMNNTKKCVEMAKKYGASVEAEIGVLGGRESLDSKKIRKQEDLYTDPELAKKFVEDTKIDALACSFGTAHGIYKVKPKLDFDRIIKIKELTNLPIVMHGGSGVSKEDYVKAIECGVRKINYYSYSAREGLYAAIKLIRENEDLTFYHEIAFAAKEAMEKDVAKAIKVFNDKIVD
ncbi:MAG: class II fructose-bisphosphate aldolase [Mollicutes bacterium]|nr:class II fructose-bisphosphate aldolase [Mollicutes bacterium]MDD7264349.1 class II fructose-bisphosphate aldolase [bacterium]MDY4979679.1 class II fructose-bisphosphate aldolase [Candidatus Onthovivens sp.]